MWWWLLFAGWAVLLLTACLLNWHSARRAERAARRAERAREQAELAERWATIRAGQAEQSNREALQRLQAAERVYGSP